MKVLYSPIGTVFICNDKVYYNTDLYTQIQRYKILGELTVLVFPVIVDKPRGVLKDDDGVTLVFINKVNSLKGLTVGHLKNDRIIREEVKRCDACICHVYTMHAGQVIKYARKFNRPLIPQHFDLTLFISS